MVDVSHWSLSRVKKLQGLFLQYLIPDFVINVECYSDGEVLSVLLLTRKIIQFKIHIVVMTKDAAAEVCGALSDVSKPCLVLTSDCLQSKKEAQ